MNYKLTIELVPKSAWYTNVRSNVTKDEWDRIRKKCYELAGYKCEICGDVGQNQGVKHSVECHEIWEYNDAAKLQKLTGLIALCPNCHKAKHVGMANIRGERDLVVDQLMKVNKISRNEADQYIRDCFHIWYKRSNMLWNLDISYLEIYSQMILKHTSTEDKLEYCREAATVQEPKFVEFLNNLPQCDFKAIINPQKESDPYCCDLIVNGFKSDLKTQDTPFFKVKELYGIDPQWAVTYNHKDYIRYKELYTDKGEDLLLFFDVTRQKTIDFGVNIWPMRAIFVTKASETGKMIESGSVPLHEYINRRDDTNRNAKSSYVFDARAFRLIYYEGKSIKIIN